MGLFSLLRNPLAYTNDNSMIFAVHESFLWITDLSQPDKWILPILAGIATFFSFTISQKGQQPNMGQGSGMMKMMKYVFPVMIVWLARSFPAGLAIYWFVGQFIQIFVSTYINKTREKMLKMREKEKRMKKKA